MCSVHLAAFTSVFPETWCTLSFCSSLCFILVLFLCLKHYVQWSSFNSCSIIQLTLKNWFYFLSSFSQVLLKCGQSKCSEDHDVITYFLCLMFSDNSTVTGLTNRHLTEQNLDGFGVCEETHTYTKVSSQMIAACRSQFVCCTFGETGLWLKNVAQVQFNLDEIISQ